MRTGDCAARERVATLLLGAVLSCRAYDHDRYAALVDAAVGVDRTSGPDVVGVSCADGGPACTGGVPCPSGYVNCDGDDSNGCEVPCGAGRTCGPGGQCAGGWIAMSASPLTARRFVFFAMAPERHELLVWGGLFGTTTDFADGARYNWDTDRWTMMSASPLAPRTGGQTAWTGTELFIWGGYADAGGFFGDGALYNPATDTWRMVSAHNAPDGRDGQITVWTGSEVIVYGGQDGSDAPTVSGRAYDPRSDTWGATITGPTATRAAAAWSGHELVGWGGNSQPESCSPGGALATGGTLRPPASQTATSTTGAPSPRWFATPGSDCSAFWWPAPYVPRGMFVWGGYNGSSYLNDGFVYNPVADAWTAIAAAPAALAGGGFLPAAVAFGDTVLGWSVATMTAASPVLYLYHSVSGDWQVLPAMPGAPEALVGAGAFGWTGSELIVWGGRTATMLQTNQGARFAVP